MRKPVLHASALLAATTLGLSGCVFAPSPAPEPPEVPDIEVDDVDVDVDGPAGGPGDTMDLVGTFEYDDGLLVEVSDFYRGTSSNTAIPSNEPFIAWTLRLENNTGMALGESATGDFACVMMDHEDYLEVEVDIRDVGEREPVYFSGYVD
ncbi:hypothetical protein J4H86_22710 [Spiractinospora alimapuensis]|uniref:hypothetical protein n=1 Tax=Spiractinospora alimapuensis TaxID=2820884 RepID=UPI001F225874|nr:hypothetical protein [Spiractinospora alimapuensis]QVQ51568.1 hypothetical protein J4H86_22710 [Spiractinospora alimapuensis]